MTLLEKDDPTVRPRFNQNGFVDWLVEAKPGDTIVYHRGFLPLDTHQPARRMADPDRLELARLAEHALLAASRGLVFLLQRRHGAEDYSYLAVARSRSARSRVMGAA